MVMKKQLIMTDLPSHHCATIVGYEGGTLGACYGGWECTDNQRILLFSLDHDGQCRSDFFRFEDRTGNPLLIRYQNEIFIIYSYFEKDIEEVNHPVMRWAYCSQWVRKITVSNNSFNVEERRPLFKNPQIGFLCRCSPIESDGKLVLPLYHESSRYGVFFEWMNDMAKMLGKVGQGGNALIQPSIWFDGSRYHMLGRNMRPSIYGAHAWYSSSVNLKNWQEPLLEPTIDNFNNSLVVINDDEPDPLIIWNKGCNRNSLMLGKLSGHGLGRELITLNTQSHPKYGAYPNYCFDLDDNLHLIWTDADEMIKRRGNKYPRLVIGHLMLKPVDYRILRSAR